MSHPYSTVQLLISGIHRVERVERKDKNAKGLRDERFIVESQDIYELALESGALASSEMRLVDASWTRIVKPEPGTAPRGLIFYDVHTVKDGKVAMSDIVCYIPLPLFHVRLSPSQSLAWLTNF